MASWEQELLSKLAAIGLAPDAVEDALFFASITLGAANVNTVVDVPNGARGFRLYPNGNACQFSTGDTAPTSPVVAIAGTDQAITTDQLSTGGIAKKDAWEVRILAEGLGRKLNLRSATAALVVDVEFF